MREVLESYSPYGDGLSFGQASTAGRPYLSSGFTANTEVEEPYDSLSFSGGRIEPGGKVAMTFVISDASPEKLFFLLQQPGEVVASMPPPAAEVAEAPARTRPAGTQP